MVLMKKGATPNKNQQQFKKGRTPVKAKPDMDKSDDDSTEAPQLQKTPADKGTKGRLSMSEKKVSFALGKGSPAGKTPQKGNSILTKKQPTPAGKGRTSLLEFKGMKGKAEQEEAEDSDDDDEDADFVISDADDDDDIDLDMEDDDDEDEEEDNEDDEEEDNEDDEEEDDDEDNTVQIQKSPKKEKSDKVSRKEAKKDSPVEKVLTEVMKATDERKRERDCKMIWVGGLPADATEEELKGLSKDIVEVHMPAAKRKNFKGTKFAFVAFASEAKAESNFAALKSKKFRGESLNIDLVGHKSKKDPKNSAGPTELNLRKLYVSSVPLDTTIEQVASYFKKAQSIYFNFSPHTRSAFISFFTLEDAKEAYEANRVIKLSGHNLTVLYSHLAKEAPKKGFGRKRSANGGAQSPAKRIKFSKSK